MSATELDRLLADDFREFGASGRTWTKPEIITSLTAAKDAPGTRRIVTEFRTQTLADGLVLVTYRCQRTSPGTSDTFSWRSSVWRRHGDDWQMVFHQGTPSIPDQPSSATDADLHSIE